MYVTTQPVSCYWLLNIYICSAAKRVGAGYCTKTVGEVVFVSQVVVMFPHFRVGVEYECQEKHLFSP